MAEWYPEDGWKDDGMVPERCLNGARMVPGMVSRIVPERCQKDSGKIAERCLNDGGMMAE